MPGKRGASAGRGKAVQSVKKGRIAAPEDPSATIRRSRSKNRGRPTVEAGGEACQGPPARVDPSPPQVLSEDALDAIAENITDRVLAKVRGRMIPEGEPPAEMSWGGVQLPELETRSSSGVERPQDLGTGVGNANVAGIFSRAASELTGGQSLFQSGSIGVAARVPDEVKQRIWAGEFVEMAELLDGKDRERLGQGKRSGGEKGKTTVPEILPFDLWSKAWNRYQAILVGQAKALNGGDASKLGEDLAHHMEMVAAINGKHANWGFYEREFRLLVARGEANWGRSHLELLLHTFLFENRSGDNDMGGRRLATGSRAGTSGTLPTGACFQFQRTGTCPVGPACKFQHSCVNCQKGHPVAKCPRPLGILRLGQRFMQSQQQGSFGGPRQMMGTFNGPHQQQSAQGQNPFRTQGGQGPPPQRFGAKGPFQGAGFQAKGPGQQRQF